MSGWRVRGGAYLLCEGLVPCFDKAEVDEDEGDEGRDWSSSVVVGSAALMDFGFSRRLG